MRQVDAMRKEMNHHVSGAEQHGGDDAYFGWVDRSTAEGLTMPGPSVLELIRGLDPVRDHERIVFLGECYGSSFDTTRALEFAL